MRLSLEDMKAHYSTVPSDLTVVVRDGSVFLLSGDKAVEIALGGPVSPDDLFTHYIRPALAALRADREAGL